MTRGQYYALLAAFAFSLVAVSVARRAAQEVAAMRGELPLPRQGEFAA